MNNQEINITLFYCSNSFSPEEIHKCASEMEKVQLNTISLPCSGKVDLLYLLKAIETGSDGVILLTCRIGECRYLQGNIRAQKRTEATDDLLFETGTGRGRIKCVRLQEGNKIEILTSEIAHFCKDLKKESHLVKEKIYDIK
jgi:coenzyme F420-reducing hydrogenase delta subunit